MKRLLTLIALSLQFTLLPACSDDAHERQDAAARDEDAATPAQDATPGPSRDSAQTSLDAALNAGAQDASANSATQTAWQSEQTYQGGEFHLGPVDYEESKFHNACASERKYLPEVRAAEGTLLAGLWNGIPNVQSYCDACIRVQTERGKSAVLRVVTWGDTTANSIDVSPEAFQRLSSGEAPRTMRFNFVDCPDAGELMYEFKTGAHEWWTAFWVRNVRLPVEKVEVKSANHDFQRVSLESDGSWVDGGGFGKGPFTIRVTAANGQVWSDTFSWPQSGVGGQLLTGSGNL